MALAKSYAAKLAIRHTYSTNGQAIYGVDMATGAEDASAQEFGNRQQAFLDFVLDQYVAQGVGELDSEKLSPLLKLRYSNAIADAVLDLGNAQEIRRVFVDFQRHLY